MAHVGEEVALGLVGVLRLPAGLLRHPARLIQSAYLAFDLLGILEKEQYHACQGHKAYPIDHVSPLASHVTHNIIQGIIGQNRHQIPLAVGKLRTVQVLA